ncbi:jg4673 [Pararge aegeria aegeria]|uniref:Jg4673 protein n=1 Tax=Pararge aegeria aegeria TaxID=348720 RepID=A0A8S4QYR1_9NEOP|nr:jg4673 [Pararge aegeria aegeria]
MVLLHRLHDRECTDTVACYRCTPQTTDGGSYNLPEVYVDEHILKPTMLNYLKDDLEESSLYNDKVYETNGSIFREYVTKSSDKGILTAFEIRTGGKMKLTILESSDKHLPISIQETPYGLIINSKVLLTTKQWNTLVDHNDTQKCIVCGTTVSDTSNHVNSDVHKRNLKKYQPLKEFDLNITRLIEDMYHCSVCNESFDIDKDSEHFASKSHVQNMLFAQNRMSDVIDDLDTHYGYDRYKVRGISGFV